MPARVCGTGGSCIQAVMANQNPTADYRKYSKGPNFLGIVIGSGVVILLVIVAVYFFLRSEAGKVVPHTPNPTPNSLSRPLFASPQPSDLV